MAMVINYADKRVEIKIVYYGPAAAGKTTSLQYLASSRHGFSFRERQRSYCVF